MILKNKLDVSEIERNSDIVSRMSIGDYDLIQISQNQKLTEEDIENDVPIEKEVVTYSIGTTMINLSEIPRTGISIEVRTGKELLEKPFFTEAYNIIEDRVYYNTHILLRDRAINYIFDNLGDATEMQYLILFMKSNGFFKSLNAKEQENDNLVPVEELIDQENGSDIAEKHDGE